MTRPEWTGPARAIFAALLAASGFSVVGMFLLGHAPSVVAPFGGILPWLIRIPTWIYLAALPLVVFVLAYPLLGGRRGLAVLVWASGVGLLAELLGTTTGFPFGPYAYGEVLGAKLFGHVPVSIPPSWYAIGLISFLLASRVAEGGAARVVLGATFMVLWDVALDPPMSHGFPAWTWQVDGFFYGMPLINLAGWAITSVVLVAGLQRIGFRENRPAPTADWPRWVWLASALLPLGISVVRGMWWAVISGTVAIAIPVLMVWRFDAARRTPIRLVRRRHDGELAPVVVEGPQR